MGWVAAATAVTAVALVGCSQSAAEGRAPGATGDSNSNSNSANPANPASTARPAESAVMNAPASAPEPGRERRSVPGQRAAVDGAAPERVVQRLSPVASASGAEARTSAGNDSAVAVPGGTITPRHVEDELDRLEAELAN